MTRLLTVVVLAAACSSHAPAPIRPTEGSGSAAGSGSAVAGAGSGSSGASIPAGPKVTEGDCLELFEHMIQLDLKARPPDHQLTPDQIADTRAKMKQELMPQCLALQPQQVACVRAAPTLDAVRACER